MAKAKVLKVNVNNMVNEIMLTAGVNKENAQNIFNVFTKSWNLNRIDFLKAIETGIVTKKAVRRTPAKKAVKKATAPKKVAVVAKVKKTKKVLTKTAKKVKKAKKVLTPKVETSSTTSATA